MSLNQITIEPIIPLWLIALLYSLGLTAALIQYRLTRGKLGRKRALIISLLRLGSISFIVAFSLNPSLVTEKVHRVAPALAVLVDMSRSMERPAFPGQRTRLDEAKALIGGGENPILHSLGEKFEVNLYGLGESLRLLGPADLANLKGDGNKGDIGEAIKALSGKHSVAILLSDGNLRWDENEAKELPVIALPVGDPKEYKDILIREIKAPAFVFRGREAVIDVAIKSYGYEGSILPVLLKDSSRLLTAKNIHVESNPGEVVTSFSFVPTEVGQKNLLIEVPQQVGENIVTNNQIHFTLQVIPDKTRVLMVSGRPSMNYRFLRNALKRDPSIDLLSFVILRSPSDILNVQPHEQSLIPFPVDTLFSRELANFDLLIFDNFNYSTFLRPVHLESIRNFVKDGGGFAMIGGPNLYYEEGDRSSPIGDILPFQFVRKEFYQRDSPVRVRLSRAGTQHAVLRFTDDYREEDADNLSFWQDLPPLDGINLIEAKKSSTVLMESADGIPWPVLIVGGYGKGRVLTLATDYSWKWYMGLVAGGSGPQPYQKLVHRMVRWLTKDPSLDPVQIILPEMAPVAGQEMAARIQFHSASERSDQPVAFSVFDPEEVKITAELKPTQQPGEYLISFVPKEGGIYRIKVDTPLGPFEESVAVAGPFERFDAAPDPDQLRRIAAATGGKYLSQQDDLLKEVEARGQKIEKRFTEEKHLPMWATPAAMVILLSILSLEWYLRRRWGLI
jgi:uncharacterized membrane protein